MSGTLEGDYSDAATVFAQADWLTFVGPVSEDEVGAALALDARAKQLGPNRWELIFPHFVYRGLWEAACRRRNERVATGHEILPSHDIAAERALLGAVFLRPAILASIDLEAVDFYVESHQILFRAMVALHNSGSAPDVITIRDYLRRKEQLALIGGTAYLAELASGCPWASNAPHYAEIIRRCRARRIVFEAALRLLDEAYCLRQMKPRLPEGIDGAIEPLQWCELGIKRLAKIRAWLKGGESEIAGCPDGGHIEA